MFTIISNTNSLTSVNINGTSLTINVTSKVENTIITQIEFSLNCPNSIHLNKTFDVSIDECEFDLSCSVKGEYLTIFDKQQSFTTEISVKSQIDERGVIVDLYSLDGEHLGGLGYLNAQDLLKLDSIAV